MIVDRFGFDKLFITACKVADHMMSTFVMFFGILQC